ncbi:MAG: PilZ domain-containing protein [Pseudomonadales bacterium]|jgi:hypothetical protein|nr:PilZ domain-containing protein [Pseudomonadales bacterium]
MNAADQRNRRRRQRYADEATEVVLRGPERLDGEPRELLDYSRDGLAFAHDEALDPGIVLELEVDSGELHVTGIPALVCDCTVRGEGFRIGVAFAPERLGDDAATRLCEGLHRLENILERRI